MACIQALLYIESFLVFRLLMGTYLACIQALLYFESFLVFRPCCMPANETDESATFFRLRQSFFFETALVVIRRDVSLIFSY